MARAGGGVEAEDEGGPADVGAVEAIGGLVAGDEAEAKALEEERELKAENGKIGREG